MHIDKLIDNIPETKDKRQRNLSMSADKLVISESTKVQKPVVKNKKSESINMPATESPFVIQEATLTKLCYLAIVP